MIKLRHQQASLWHRGLTEDIEGLWEPWMRLVDELLEDEPLLVIAGLVFPQALEIAPVPSPRRLLRGYKLAVNRAAQNLPSAGSQIRLDTQRRRQIKPLPQAPDSEVRPSASRKALFNSPSICVRTLILESSLEPSSVRTRSSAAMLYPNH